ncbi:MAG: glycoside hydrolase family 13 protein [Flavobacteriaceae bacterium]|nr:glycoside hydrolase family 13 protein [Flavobacteriaceae bacterium]
MKKTRLIIVIFLINIAMFGQEIKRVEPPFWWSGMQNKTLQLMIYGDDIASFKPTFTNNSIEITGLVKTENPNYLFIDLNLEKASAGTFELLFKKGKKELKYTYELKQRKQNSSQRKGFNSADVVYLLMPDRFSNGNPQNDSHPQLTEKLNRTYHGGRHGGDIQGIINQLDYIKELGATAIWSTPMLEDNDDKYSYHTYAQSDVYKIDPRFGTNDDYKRLADEMHQRNMKLIMDYVTNHWGIKHWMMNDLPTYTWIHQFPGYANSNYRMTTQYDPNASKIDAKYCMDGWFVPTMPDLNQSNPLVLNYLTQNAIWWVEFAGLDGFRVDTYSYNDKEAISKWTKSIMDEYPNFNIVGEVWMHDQAQIAFWQKDSKIGAIKSYNSYLPSVMDFTLHDAITNVFNEENPNWNDGMIKVYENFVNDFLYPDINNIMVFAENHDTQRIHQLYKDDVKKYKLAMTLLATIRGIPQIYYGSEIGMTGDKNKGDGDIRRDFPGGWAGDTNDAFTIAGRTEKQQELFGFTSKLLNWRKGKSVIHFGKTTHYLPENNVYVYFRYNEKEKVMVVINNSPNEQTIKLNRFKESIEKQTSGYEILSGISVDLSKEILVIPKKSPMIIELK